METAPVRAMVEIRPGEFDQCVKDFFLASNEFHEFYKNREKNNGGKNVENNQGPKCKIERNGDFWEVSEITWVKNPERFHIKINHYSFYLSQAYVIAEKMLSLEKFRSSGRHLILIKDGGRKQKIKFYVSRNGDDYVVKRWPKNKKDLINRKESKQRRMRIDGCRVQPDEVVEICPDCQFEECKTNPEHQN